MHNDGKKKVASVRAILRQAEARYTKLQSTDKEMSSALKARLRGVVTVQ